MPHTMKIWEMIIDRRLREETTIGDEQFGFMPGRGTTDAIFAVRQLMEKQREKQKGLHNSIYSPRKCVLRYQSTGPECGTSEYIGATLAENGDSMADDNAV